MLSGSTNLSFQELKYYIGGIIYNEYLDRREINQGCKLSDRNAPTPNVLIVLNDIYLCQLSRLFSQAVNVSTNLLSTICLQNICLSWNKWIIHKKLFLSIGVEETLGDYLQCKCHGRSSVRCIPSIFLPRYCVHFNGTVLYK